MLSYLFIPETHAQTQSTKFIPAPSGNRIRIDVICTVYSDVTNLQAKSVHQTDSHKVKCSTNLSNLLLPRQIYLNMLTQVKPVLIHLKKKE